MPVKALMVGQKSALHGGQIGRPILAAQAARTFG
jgi:hypothetical protein